VRNAAAFLEVRLRCQGDVESLPKASPEVRLCCVDLGLPPLCRLLLLLALGISAPSAIRLSGQYGGGLPGLPL
jgi:hypothetical protein